MLTVVGVLAIVSSILSFFFLFLSNPVQYDFEHEEGGGRSKMAELAARWLRGPSQSQDEKNRNTDTEESQQSEDEDNNFSEEKRDIVAKFAFRWLSVTKQRQVEYTAVNTEDDIYT